MNRIRIGMEVARRRRDLGWTQAELAERMGSTQAVVSRLESGAGEPSLSLLERVARATGEPLVLTLGVEPRPVPAREARGRIEAALGPDPFNPWDRGPSDVEERSLLADGLTRERFER